MTNDQQLLFEDNSPRILLVDDDPIFGFGLRALLTEQGFGDLALFEQVMSGESALATLSERLPDVIILELNLRLNNPTQFSGLQLCREIRRLYPNLPIFLLTSQTNPEQLLAAYNLGVKGYCVKGTPIDTLVRGLKEVIKGNDYWQVEQNIREIIPRQRSQKWITVQRRVGLEQIDTNLKKVNECLSDSRLPVLDWLFWTGRRRELLLARWLVSQLLPVEYVIIDNPQGVTPPLPNNSSSPIVQASQIALVAQRERNIASSTNVFEKTLTQIQSGVDNLTNTTLEIDILRSKTKKELLYLVLNQVVRTTEKLKLTETTEQDLFLEISAIVKDLWQCCSFDFIAKYYDHVFTENVQLLDILLKEAEFISKNLLEEIPFRLEVFQYLISPNYQDEPEAVKKRFELLWQNLLIEIANSVMLTILNNFLDQEILQPEIYNETIVSSRDIARFRNRLSWKYRADKYLEEPKNIFEDQHRIFYFDNKGIASTFIKASRKTELKQLKGFRWLVTIAIEARDAIAPGTSALIDSLGKTVVFLLTEVIGKAIGLIGKGFFQGIGNTLQETRYRKNQRNK
ncbi:DUF3685 domain-containing protein [Gloeocapsa sp. PCC 73106]|uniref:DUF3685 domain-containing protein n=1 Tax=Gloeocapsa sp. PCC 73106 TaxID=102232 RepID=UPI0002ABFBF9|nr:DUF3685 domain-containing protein [Gloeocapsa sp. PCC 73106]ELR99810.1 response regulator containing a CheY-like receiver domain and an HTH DNA-binding domain [Gloeocapsa sp. PCC 73106]